MALPYLALRIESKRKAARDRLPLARFKSCTYASRDVGGEGRRRKDAEDGPEKCADCPQREHPSHTASSWVGHSATWTLLVIPPVPLAQCPSRTTSSSLPSADSGSGTVEEGTVTVIFPPASATAAQQRLPSGCQMTEEEDDSPSQTASADVDVLAAVVGPYSPTPAWACPVRLMHTG